jgi:hypothetical protein
MAGAKQSSDCRHDIRIVGKSQRTNGKGHWKPCFTPTWCCRVLQNSGCPIKSRDIKGGVGPSNAFTIQRDIGEDNRTMHSLLTLFLLLSAVLFLFASAAPSSFLHRRSANAFRSAERRHRNHKRLALGISGALLESHQAVRVEKS